MKVSTQSINSISVEQEIVRLKGVLAELQGALQASRTPPPAGLVAELERLVDGMVNLQERSNRLEEERQNLAASVQIGHMINSSLDLDEVLQIMMDSLLEITRAERGFFMLPDSMGEMKIRLARNWEQENIHPAEAIYSTTIIKRVIGNGLPVLTTNASEDPRFSGQNSVALHNLRSILCVPLKMKDKVTGVIYADHSVRAGLFNRKDLDMLVVFADQAAVAIENASLFASVRRSLAEVTALKNLMDNVLGSITSAVLAIDLNGKLSLCNRSAEKLLGLPAAQLVGADFPTALPGLALVLRPLLRQVINTHQPVIARDLRFNLRGTGMLDLQVSLSELCDESGASGGVTLIMEDLTETRQLEAQRRMFERMVSPAVIQQLDPNSLRLGGHRSEITILFADLRDFTPFSEDVEPEDLVRVLNCYLAAAAEAVLREGGTVDKFIGDAVMAWFNAPVPQIEHTLHAVRAALAMRDAVIELHSRLPESYHLSFGIGIHQGEAVMGLVGSEQRLDYTAVGDAVNTARRIQENAEGGQILISQEVYRAVAGQVNVAAVDPIQAKGKRDLVTVYDLLCLAEPEESDLEGLFQPVSPENGD